MSLHYPRRVKDLPSLVDNDEDYLITPEKRHKDGRRNIEGDVDPNESNKENPTVQANNNNKSKKVFIASTNAEVSLSSTGSHTNTRTYPKRCSELPTLESDDDTENDDDDDESNDRNENLNCAILNDSFIMSPGRHSDIDDASSSQPGFLSSVKKPHRRILQYDETHDNLSFVSRFGKMDLDKSNNQLQTPYVVANNIKSNSNKVNCATQLKSINETQPKEDCYERIQEMETPYKPITDNIGTQQKTTTNTTNALEAQFATPQVRTFSAVRRRPYNLCSSQMQKSRAAVASEFRSQKVLFQTPMSIARPPITTLPNESLTLSVCDRMTPNTAEKAIDAIANDKSISNKTKKSLDMAFSGVQLEQSNEPEKPKQNPDHDAPAKTSPTTTTTSSSQKQTTLKINDFEYKILNKLGTGGSSSVYLAQCIDNNRECALKVVDLQGDPAVVEGYLNETKLLAKLQGHECVVALYDYQLLRKESRLFLVMENGDSDLHKILQTYTTDLPLYVLMNFLYQMLQAVNYIHQNGVIHSDLKPANFLMVGGRLKLIDFGIASNIAIDSTSIIKFSQAGTFNYISPEALTDTSTGSSPMRNSNQPKIKLSTKSDVWSLGCILYLFLYKKTPFSHIKNVYQKITAISNPLQVIEYPSIPTYYPIILVEMLKNCLQHDPKKRPSCAELLQYPFNMIIPIKNLSVSSNNVRSTTAAAAAPADPN